MIGPQLLDYVKRCTRCNYESRILDDFIGHRIKAHPELFEWMTAKPTLVQLFEKEKRHKPRLGSEVGPTVNLIR